MIFITTRILEDDATCRIAQVLIVDLVDGGEKIRALWSGGALVMDPTLLPDWCREQCVKAGGASPETPTRVIRVGTLKEVIAAGPDAGDVPTDAVVAEIQGPVNAMQRINLERFDRIFVSSREDQRTLIDAGVDTKKVVLWEV